MSLPKPSTALLQQGPKNDRNSCGCYGEANQARFAQRGTGLDMSQWHTYAAQWEPTEVRFYIDGQLQGAVAAFDSTQQPMHLLLYNWTTGWEDENVPNASTEPELDVFVDWCASGSSDAHLMTAEFRTVL
jgi:beta-glucanase (GH16 family)